MVAARIVDQVSAHGSSCNCEEMSPTAPIYFARRIQFHIRLVQERRSLEGVIRALAAQVVRCQPVQLWQHDFEEARFCFAISIPLLSQEVGEFVGGYIHRGACCQGLPIR